ncbi:ribosomal L7Ae/L30e/S12e/Gadd45 family protein [Candidatus Woesearchaeota archaeon]|nr:ribosomal L7Ae/L30e/S12e/Gadd45 family protein [Candidatus Woesearchaeota archaeon]
MSELDELRKGIEKETVTIGSKTTMLNLKIGKIEKIFITKNCPKEVRDEIKHTAEKTKVVELDMLNSELGVFCKKPFSISMIGFLKSAGK